MSLVYTFDFTSSRTESYRLAMMACDISLNFFKSFTTRLPKKVVPSSRVGSGVGGTVLLTHFLNPHFPFILLFIRCITP